MSRAGILQLESRLEISYDPTATQYGERVSQACYAAVLYNSIMVFFDVRKISTKKNSIVGGKEVLGITDSRGV